MSFSERQGLKRARDVLQVEDMDDDLRNSLWNVLLQLPLNPLNCWDYLNTVPVALQRASRLQSSFFKQPIDDLPHICMEVLREIKGWYFQADWNEVYDLIEFCGDLSEDYNFFAETTNFMLEREGSGYRLIGKQIAPVTSGEEIEAIDRAMSPSDKFAPASAHIRAALEHLANKRDPNFRNSIKEAISAVEAACCIVAGDRKASLGVALKQLQKHSVPLHPALNKAFDSLYGYTNDADGIRHKLLEEESLAMEDARFMLIACSAFVNYLRVKATNLPPT